MKRVLLIGATSSIATDIAHRYASDGDRLYLLGRSSEKLGALVAELSDSVLGSLCLDFDDADANAQAVETAFGAVGEFEVVLLAHGYLGDQLKSEEDYQEAAKTIAVNFLSVVSFLIPLANKLDAQGHGTLAVISSVAGERGRPRNYTYGSAKSAVTTYMQGVRSRLYGKVYVCTIKLGPVDTPMTRDHEKNASFISSETAAKKILSALARRRTEPYVPGFWWAVMMVVRNLPEALFQRLKFLSAR